MRRLPLAAALLVSASAAGAAPPRVAGEYESPLGRIRLEGDGTRFRGLLVAPRGPCRFAAGDRVLEATLLDDSLAGRVRLCLTGCAEAEAWASGVLLVGAGGLAGALHVPPGCRGPVGQGGGVTFARARPGGAPAAAPAKARPSRREAARAALRDGAAWLHEGSFERARARFEEAIRLDPGLPEAYNGVGVTWRMRDDLPRALEWYKKALAVDPDFGDAYYNMACVYALQGKPELALRYLQIAAVNGYATAEGIDADPDLASLRGEPAYRALVKARL